jgi:hypothetical protein
MRALAIAMLLLVELGCPAHQRSLPENAAWAWGVFALVVGDYYVSHHAWPSNIEQLRLHTGRFQAKVPHAQKEGFRNSLSSFTHTEFQPRGKDILVIARFQSEGGEFRYDAIFHPGPSAEQIVDMVTPK